MRPTGLACLLVLAGAGCSPTGSSDEPGGPPRVVASIFPVADLLARVGGDAVAVEVLLPPRASPDSWEATPSQIRLMADARGYVTVGSGLDGWLEGFGELGRDVETLRLSDGMTLAHGDHGHGHGEDGGDPHIWLDPILVRDQVLPALARLLVEVAPAEAPGIRARAAAVADSLTALDGWIRQRLEAAPLRAFVATHGAWGYFAERYGLRPLGNVYERPGHEPSALGLARLVRAARTAGIPTILAEPQLASTAAEALAREVGATVTVVDPLGGPGLEGRESYFDMMRFNARAFAAALGGA